MSRPRKNKLTDNSSDAKYFILTPRLIWALARDAYDVSLWNTIKDIAGEHGECFLSTPDLATLAMMSVGKVQDSRAYWIQVEMLDGQIVRDEGYPQPVWHLTIPDIWKRNIEWAEQHTSLRDRIAYKHEQIAEFKAKRKSVHHTNAKERSPGEKGGTPHERGGLPGERKKNHKKNHKEEPPLGADAPTGEPTKKPLTARQQASDQLERYFSEQTGLPLPPRETKKEKSASAARWWNPLCDLWRLCGGDLACTEQLIEKAVQEMNIKQLTIAAPQSIVNNALAIYAKQNKGNGNSNGQSTAYQPNTYTPEEWASFKPYSADELDELRELAESAGA